MKKQELTLIKLGGSLITYKNDQRLIESYQKKITLFLQGKSSLKDLSNDIELLLNFELIKTILSPIKSHIDTNPNEKIILIHGAGSIGHSLVIKLLAQFSNIQDVYPLVKYAVNIQNELLVASAIELGIPAIPMSSYQLITGVPTDKISTPLAIAKDLTILEDIIKNTNAIPVFFGDVGYTPNGWKVFSGDLIPSMLMKHLKTFQVSNVIFLTNVNNKKTGIYTKDPIYNDAEFISEIIVENDGFKCFNSENRELYFNYGSTREKLDVTGSMEGKLFNLIELAKGFARCWVIGIEDLNKALRKQKIGTYIHNLHNPSANIIFLGTGDAFATNGRKSAGILIEMINCGILLDCGPNALQSINVTGRTTDDIDIILVSHFHGDHLAGIPFFLLEASLVQKRVKPLKIMGPPGLKEVVENLFLTFYGSIAKEKLPFSCEFIKITSEIPFFVNNVNIRAFKMVHTPEAQGYRLEFDKIKICYSGDTGWTENLFKLSENSDLTIVECSFFEKNLDIHLNYQQIKKLIPFTKNLALIHLGEETINNMNIIANNPKILIPFEGQELFI